MTPRIPELARELERAAARRARRHSWARRPVALALVAALMAVTTAGAAVIIARGHVGGEPTRPDGADAAEANSRLPLNYATRPVVLGVGALAHGRRYELVGYQLRSRFGTNLCLDIHILPGGAGYGCGNDRERAQGAVSGPGGTLVSGATEPEVARVDMRYTTTAAGTATASAALLHVDGSVLAKIRVTDPFGFYIAELPAGVRHAEAEAFDASGRSLWRASFLTLPSHAAARQARQPRARTTLLGRSVDGRPIRLTELGRSGARPVVLVVGCIHGDECAGSAVTRRLRASASPQRGRLLIVDDLNPDGRARGTRTNARGVDLNRNFPGQWRRRGVPFDPQYSGPRPSSEPETRIAERLIRRIRPDVTL